MVNQELDALLVAGWPELDASARERISRFRDVLVAENAVQNLTRLVSPQDFYEGHVLDVRALIQSGLVEFPAMDLGSGGGVPGLLAAVVQGDPVKRWVLVDAEGHKARFLKEAAEKLGVQAEAYSGRAESWLEKGKVSSIVARAVGPVDRIYAWIGERSTWNNLVLLKGPGWQEEWKKFQASKHRGRLRVESTFEYRVGAENKQRTIVRLARVPRGTSIADR